MADYQVISTKCPVLNTSFRREAGYSSPDLEVLVRLENTEPKSVICPEYSHTECAKRKEGCIYRQGWQSLK